MVSCRTAGLLLDRYVDGALKPGRAEEIAAHLESCAACARRAALARRLASGLASPSAVPAPAGFRGKVMDEVHRLGMAGYPSRAEEVDREARRGGFYRRLGFCFMVSAALLAISLGIPRASYPTIVASKVVAADLAADRASIVRATLMGADRLVRGTLMKPAGPEGETNGGDAR